VFPAREGLRPVQTLSNPREYHESEKCFQQEKD